MVGSLIEKYKTYRKQSFLKQFDSYKHKYAFVGVGNHSLSNLYPVIDYLGVPLKYICTKDPKNAEMMVAKYPNTIGTSDINQVFQDDEVKGMFISTSPNSHYKLCKMALQAGKSVFIEKPPCLNSTELQELIQLKGKQPCAVGLQKRYAKVYSAIKLKAKHAISYNYKFLTGSYPEGDPIWDLYIHPLDVVVFLFGRTNNVSVVRNGNTIHCQITHENGVIGTIELSTDYSWSTPVESLTVNDKSGTYESSDLYNLKFTSKQKEVLGIPLEKVLKNPPVTKQLYLNNGFVPTAEFNQITTNGYYDEIKTFLAATEGKGNRIKSTLESLIPTFELIEKIK